MSTIKIFVQDRENQEHHLEVPTDMALNLMEALKMYELPVEGICGGMALCASCQVYVEKSSIDLSFRNDAEEEMLDQAFFVQKNSRLACQIPITKELDGAYFRLAPWS